MHRLELVELIESQIARLTEEGRSLWHDAELAIEASRPGDDVEPTLKIVEESLTLPHSDEVHFKVLFDLRIGLSAGDMQENTPNADLTRRWAVISAAVQKDVAENRQDMFDATLR